MNSIIYIRDEYIENEYRTPLVPCDLKKLIDNGFTIYIETSNKRIYSNNEYDKISNHIIITNKKWYDSDFSDALIIGLKELDNQEYCKLNNHIHIFFSHTYKNQINSHNILSYFKNSNSIIYDFEYFVDNNDKRLISFGFYAGIVGGFLGLLQYVNKILYKTNINNLIPYNSYSYILSFLMNYSILYNNLNIGIIGHNGRCGRGVIDILDRLNIKYTIIQKDFIKDDLVKFDIFYNCILLDTQDIVLYDEMSNFNQYITIVDISCDYLKPNNPIKLYKNNTTWKEPVFEYNNLVDIIAINNLPSLLPKDSSDYFSKIFCELLLNYNNDHWKVNKDMYYSIISNL